MAEDAFLPVEFYPHPVVRHESWLHELLRPRPRVFVVHTLDFETAAAWSNCWAHAPYRVEVRA